MENFLEEICYAQIVRISSLLVYFNLQLNPIINLRFQNNRLLFSLGATSDRLTAYLNLKQIADCLTRDIFNFLGEFEDPYPWGFRPSTF